MILDFNAFIFIRDVLACERGHASVGHSCVLLDVLWYTQPLLAAGVPNGEQPKYFMLNLVYAVGVIETPSEWDYRGTGVEDTKRTALKVRSKTQYLQAYLSLGVPYTPSNEKSPSQTPHRPLFISELEIRIIQATLAFLPVGSQEFSVHRPNERKLKRRTLTRWYFSHLALRL